MEKLIISPWNWQEQRKYVQAVEIKNFDSILFLSGQAAINEDGISSNENMREQLIQTFQNIEKVVAEAKYELKNIVALTIYTTSNNELLENFDVFEEWIHTNEIKQTLTVLEVKSLFETLKVEIEAKLIK